MKTIQLGCKRLIAGAAIAFALAAKADTVVWYTFDDLGDVGTSIADSSTIQNKANPGVHDATAYGMVGMTKTPGSTRKAIVTNGIDSVMRIVDPVGDTASSDVDSALHFWAGNPAGNGMTLEIPNDAALRPSAFTVEMFVRYFEEPSNWQTLACQPSRSGKGYAWRLACYKDAKGNAGLWFTNETTQVGRRCGVGDFDFSDRKWHHVAFTYAPHATDPTKCVIKVYFDYNKINEWNGVEFVIDWPDSADCPIQIGGTTVEHSAFCGEISEFRFSSGAMDPGEFLRPHNAAIDKDVVLYYDFEESNVYDGNFGTTENNLLNKASPIMPGTFQTAVGTDSKTYPFIDEASPGHRVLPSQNAESERTMKSTHAFRNASYRVVGANTSRLKCTPVYEDLFRDAEDFTVEMFYKCGEKNYSDETIVQSAKLLVIPGQFEVGFANSTAQMMPILHTSGGMINFSSGPRVDDGKWHHVAVVVSQSGGSKTFSWYHDGNLYANQSKSFSGTVSPMKQGEIWHIGTLNGGRAFDGWIDSLRITLRALSPSEFLRAENQPGLTIIVR